MTRILMAALVAAITLLAVAPPARAGDPEPGTDAYVQKTIDSRRVTLNFPDVPIQDVFQFLQDITGITVVLDPALDAEAPVTLQVKDQKLRSALNHIVAALGADATYEVWRGTIFITSKSQPKPAPKDLPEAEGKKLAAKKVTVNFPDSPLADVVRFLSDIQGPDGVKLSVAPGVEKSVRLKMKDATIADVLAVICRVYELDAAKEGEGLVLKGR